MIFKQKIKICIPYRTKFRRTRFSMDKIFLRKDDFAPYIKYHELPYRTKFRRTKFSTDKSFRRTKLSTPRQNFDNFVRRIILSDEFLSETFIWCTLYFCSILDKNNKEAT